jgi:hypothetical protein
MRWQAHRNDDGTQSRGSVTLSSARRWWLPLVACAALLLAPHGGYGIDGDTVGRDHTSGTRVHQEGHPQWAASAGSTEDAPRAERRSSPNGAPVTTLLFAILMLVAVAGSSGGRFVTFKPRIAFLRRGPPHLRTSG